MSAAKKLCAAGLAVLSLKLAFLSGAGTRLVDRIGDALTGGDFISASVTLELGPVASPVSELEPTACATVAPSASASPVLQREEDAGEILETTIHSALVIKNTTSLPIDPAALASEALALTLPSDSPQILIIHTHSSEAYTPDGQDVYIPTDTDRTEDIRYNVVRVGDELTAAFESFGLNVIHDRQIYDYPSYSGSYTRSGEAVEAYLSQYPELAVILDLHRDALGDGDVIYKTMAEVADETSSQIMLLCGTGDGGLEHPRWQENLQLALYLQQAASEKYPTLTRPVAVVPERYNQHLSTGSLILEVGSSGNTLQEALCAVRLFADAAAPALLKLVADGE